VECRDVNEQYVVGYKIPFEVVDDQHCAGMTKPPTSEACAAPAPADCNGHGTCDGKQCACEAGWGGATCTVRPSITKVVAGYTAGSRGVPLGDVVTVTWDATGHTPLVDVLLWKPDDKYPVYLSSKERVPNSSPYSRVFQWRLPAPGTAQAAYELGSGDGYRVQVHMYTREYCVKLLYYLTLFSCVDDDLPFGTLGVSI
jgi:hypothetical protein